MVSASVACAVPVHQGPSATGWLSLAWSCTRVSRRSRTQVRAATSRRGSALHVMLVLHRSSRQVVVTDEEFDSTDMIGELLGKRQRVANQP
jgi:hypothetical protein